MLVLEESIKVVCKWLYEGGLIALSSDRLVCGAEAEVMYLSWLSDNRLKDTAENRKEWNDKTIDSCNVFADSIKSIIKRGI